MRLLFGLGFAAIVALVQGCASPTDQGTLGEETPDPTTDPVGGDTKTTPTPAPNPGGTPTPAAPGAPVPAPPKAKSTMTFFVTSSGSGLLGGNLGGLVGADKKCQDLAVAANGADHTWHAYLSITGTNAKDRIGAGPWTNQKGKVIASSVITLHDYLSNLKSVDIVDEKGAIVPIKLSAILTGSKQDGTPALQNCTNWTSLAANTQAHTGDTASDTSPLLGVRWNDAVKNSACTPTGLTAGGGEGRLYCFAID